MKIKTVYQVQDRQGIKYFSQRPEYHGLHDVFVGKRCNEPKRGKHQVIRKFVTNVLGHSAWSMLPKRIKVDKTIAI